MIFNNLKIRAMKPRLINDYYQISNADELYWFVNFVNNIDNAKKRNGLYCSSANAVLTANITINENLLSRLVKDNNGNVTNGNDFKAWSPIGYFISFSNNVYYAGTFDGKGHTISGLYFNNDEQSSVGLFGLTIKDAVIKNVGVIDSYFSGKRQVGGVCGYNQFGTIENCYNTGEVNGSGSSVGGVCGANNYNTITNCYNTGEVNGDYFVGGVCGYNDEGGTIENCYNTGKVSGSRRSTAGICGLNEGGTIKNCYDK